MQKYLDMLHDIHTKTLSFTGGSIQDEFIEQVMSCMAITNYYKTGDKILEIGCNIGRNTLVLSNLVGSENIVSIDAAHEFVITCRQNLQNNNFSNFTVLPVAISNTPLKRKDWTTYEYDRSQPLEENYHYVNTITWTDFKKHYGTFQILVADCEGALYKIIQENSDFLDTIHTIIVENDYKTVEEKEAIDIFYITKGFVRIFNFPLADSILANAPQLFSIWTKHILGTFN